MHAYAYMRANAFDFENVIVSQMESKHPMHQLSQNLQLLLTTWVQSSNSRIYVNYSYLIIFRFDLYYNLHVDLRLHHILKGWQRRGS